MNREYALEKALDGLVDIVERVGCGDWRNKQGVRFKDTPQWVNAYVALHKNHAQPAALVAQVPEGFVRVAWQRISDAGTPLPIFITLRENLSAHCKYREVLAAAPSAKGEKG